MISSQFSLGDGVSSIAGTHIGRGIILNKIIPSTSAHLVKSSSSENPRQHEQKESPQHIISPLPSKINSAIQPYLKEKLIEPIVAERCEGGSIRCHVEHVKDYQELKRILNIDSCVSGVVPLVASVSTAMAFSKNIVLSREDLTLIVIGERISHVDIIPKDPNLTLDETQYPLLDSDPITFKNCNGDHYVSGVQYGEKFYAEIKILRVNNEKGEEFRCNIEARLDGLLKSPNLGFKSGSRYKKNELLDRAEMRIQISHIGVPELGFPRVTSSMEYFVNFVSKFDSQVRKNVQERRADYVIGHSTEPYASLIKTYAASQLFINVNLAKESLIEFDQLLHRAKLVTPTAEKIVEQANSYVRTHENAGQIDRLNILLRDAKRYQRSIQAIMQKIDFTQTSLSDLTFKSNGVEADKSRSVPPVSSSLPAVGLVSGLEQQAFAQQDELGNLANYFMTNIWRLEKDVEDAVASLQSEIKTLYFRQKHFDKFFLPHFHLRVPSPGAALHWRVTTLHGEPLDKVEFCVRVQKASFLSTFSKVDVFASLKNGATTVVFGMGAKDHYKVTRIRNSEGKPYLDECKITVSVCGDLALKVRNGGKALEKLDAFSPVQRDDIDHEQKSSYLDPRASNQMVSSSQFGQPAMMRPLSRLPTVEQGVRESLTKMTTHTSQLRPSLEVSRKLSQTASIIAGERQKETETSKNRSGSVTPLSQNSFFKDKQSPHVMDDPIHDQAVQHSAGLRNSKCKRD